MAVAELGGTMCAGRWADAHGRLPVSCAAAAILALALLMSMSIPAVPILLLICPVLGFVMAGLNVVPAATIVDIAESDEAATIGWRASCDFNGIVVAVVLSAVLAASGLDAGFVFTALVAAAVGVLALSIGETKVAVQHDELAA
jgi:MFS family permease